MSTADTEHQHTGPWVRQGVDGRDYCQTCGPDWPGREHFPGGVYETTGTERDERLREAREAATRARAQNPPLGIETWLITLDAEVTRLDAVVTAVRDLHQPEWVEHNFDIESDLVCKACGYFAMDEDDPCPTVRALDGGAR